MKNIQRFAALMVFLAVLVPSSGCQKTYVHSPWASRATIPVGSELRLLQPLTVPPNDNQVFIQDGNSAPTSGGITYGYDQYYPFCYFELHGLAKESRTIEKDTFTITRVYRDETEFVQSKPVQVASLVLIAGSDGDSGARLILETTVMDLHSEKQPAVRRLVCGGGFDLEPYASPPTIKEVTEVMQGVAQLVTTVPGR
jgi:hypothetical protein